MKKLFWKYFGGFFGVLPIGTFVQIDDDKEGWGDIAGKTMQVTSYCSYFGKLAYVLDDRKGEIYIKGDFKVIG